MSGKLLVTVKIGPNGEVSSSAVAANAGLSPAVVACVTGAFKRAKFDSPGRAGASLNAPLTFVLVP